MSGGGGSSISSIVRMSSVIDGSFNRAHITVSVSITTRITTTATTARRIYTTFTPSPLPCFPANRPPPTLVPLTNRQR